MGTVGELALALALVAALATAIPALGALRLAPMRILRQE
jgi:ABC-type lipoprotein release transport system permease subunit